VNPYLYYCEEFIKAQVNDRFQTVFKQKSCVRCLGMGRKHNGPKTTWWAAHEPHCRTKFACNKDGCGKLEVSNQRHITVCAKHINDNASEHDEFIKGLDPKQFPAGIMQNNVHFFMMWGPEAYQVG